MILLTTLNMAYVISTPKSEKDENKTLEQARRRVKWKNDDIICRGYILNAMQDSLFNIYQYHKYVKELWETLENKYMAKDASSKKFLAVNFNCY